MWYLIRKEIKMKLYNTVFYIFFGLNYLNIYLLSQLFLTFYLPIIFVLFQKIMNFFASTIICLILAYYKTHRILIVISIFFLLIIALVDRDVMTITYISLSKIFDYIFLMFTNKN